MGLRKYRTMGITRAMIDFWHVLIANTWLLAYAAGCLSGWHAARRMTRYMLGGRL